MFPEDFVTASSAFLAGSNNFAANPKSSLAEWDYHLHNLILNGVHQPGTEPYYDDTLNHSDRRFRRFTFTFDRYRYDSIYRFKNDTPYQLIDRGLVFNGEPLDNLPFALMEEKRATWGSEKSWWFKEVPKLQPYYDLRLNPINTCSNLRFHTGFKKDFRGCVFCQRCYLHPRETENRQVVSPAEMFDQIFQVHGKDILMKVNKVIVITGESNSEEQMIELLEEIYCRYLKPNGFKGTYSVVTTFIRDESNIRRLSQLENTFFEFPIECFSRREQILGEYKGIPIGEVAQILDVARRYFRYIRTNYLVGLDDLESAYYGFEYLCSRNLLDDVVTNIFVPFTERSIQFRRPESFGMEYVFELRKILEFFNLAPKKTGTTKDAFPHFSKTVFGDELLGGFYSCQNETAPPE